MISALDLTIQPTNRSIMTVNNSVRLGTATHTVKVGVNTTPIEEQVVTAEDKDAIIAGLKEELKQRKARHQRVRHAFDGIKSRRQRGIQKNDALVRENNAIKEKLEEYRQELIRHESHLRYDSSGPLVCQVPFSLEQQLFTSRREVIQLERQLAAERQKSAKINRERMIAEQEASEKARNYPLVTRDNDSLPQLYVNPVNQRVDRSSEPLIFLGWPTILVAVSKQWPTIPFSFVHQFPIDEIRFGQTTSYGELASMAGNPRASRAVGSAMRSNPFLLLVPCHRVLNKDGSVGNFSGTGGPALKQWLLSHESHYLADY
ncbi:unnamed protein product [Medioppia subpectinata]|uniref:Methylated-DNA--protein-cysteine methyltransferase n=1 Tax=Medioppia subpectinata TaxID=1979941 RepID=A0A7R9L3Q8_9ACAR|nr:unnamed protein product [Medioppia subpectinata]CAG2114743.1 unnamed protein product [Medioppia subpectinata]